jgi:hypothetical protein
MATCQIPNPPMPAGFIEAWQAAGKHLESAIGSRPNWLNPSPYNIMGSHLTFALGNQVFFVYVEIDKRPLAVMETMFLRCAESANAVACVLPMRMDGSGYVPASSGTGLLDARTRVPVDPVSKVTTAPVEMSDWEVHDFAVQVVAGQLRKEGKDIKNTQSHLQIDPSIWFEDRVGAAGAVVRAVRYPGKDAPRPSSLPDMAQTVRRRNMRCFFASVGLASAEQSRPDNANRTLPLLRGGAMVSNYRGLEEVRG